MQIELEIATMFKLLMIVASIQFGIIAFLIITLFSLDRKISILTKRLNIIDIRLKRLYRAVKLNEIETLKPMSIFPTENNE